MGSINNSVPDFGAGKKSLSVYVIGLALCIVLTLIPFFVVMYGQMERSVTMFVLFSSAILQFLVQVVCFLRLNYSTRQSRMNVMAFVFTIIVLVILIGGSLWIMWHLNYNMMN